MAKKKMTDVEGAEWLLNRMNKRELKLRDVIYILNLLGGRLILVDKNVK